MSAGGLPASSASRWLAPTPGGAWFALTHPGSSDIRRLLLTLLSRRVTPASDVTQLCGWLSLPESSAVATLDQAQALGFVVSLTAQRSITAAGVGTALHENLPSLSSVGKAALVDRNGLTLASAGLDEASAAALAALAADLHAVQERHSARLTGHLGLGTHGWAAVNAFGSSRLGAWPLHVGGSPLMLLVLGTPRFNSEAFLSLCWLLVNHYG